RHHAAMFFVVLAAPIEMVEFELKAALALGERLQHLDPGRYDFRADPVAGNGRDSVGVHRWLLRAARANLAATRNHLGELPWIVDGCSRARPRHSWLRLSSPSPARPRPYASCPRQTCRCSIRSSPRRRSPATTLITSSTHSIPSPPMASRNLRWP